MSDEAPVPDGERERIEQLVKDACRALGEHVDCVRIFVSYEAGNGNTASFTWKAGNWYGSYGHIVEWLKVTDARSCASEVRDDERRERSDD